MPPKHHIPRKNAKHAVEKRKTMLKKLGDPHDKDDPRWAKAYLRHAEVRLARKEKAKVHRQTQMKVGQNRRGSESLES